MRRFVARPPSPGERGSVTILVLWGIAIVFALLVATSYTTRTEVAITRNAVGAMRARYAAEAGTQIGLARLLARRAGGAAIFDGHPETWRDGTASVAIAIQDEAGRIDLNQAPLELLQGLFVAVGRPKEDALLLACRVIERRGSSAPDCHQPPDAPRRLAPSARLRRPPEELAALPGFGDRLYQSIADFVTVATGATAIDPLVAPRTVLMALPGATADLVDGWLSSRAMIEETEPEASGFETLGSSPYLMVTPVRDFTVSAIAETPEGARARAELQIRLTGLAGRPYQVMAWRTPPLPAPAAAVNARGPNLLSSRAMTAAADNEPKRAWGVGRARARVVARRAARGLGRSRPPVRRAKPRRDRDRGRRALLDRAPAAARAGSSGPCRARRRRDAAYLGAARPRGRPTHPARRRNPTRARADPARHTPGDRAGPDRARAAFRDRAPLPVSGRAGAFPAPCHRPKRPRP